MTILGIDPGTNCGWSLRSTNGHHISGVWDLKPRRFEGGGMRFIHLRNFLSQPPKPDLVAFEEVRRHLGTDAAHVYGGIVATLTAWCEENKIPYTAIPVGTVKKFATGKGNANKDAMLTAASVRWPNSRMTDDNEADARFIAEVAALQISSIRKQTQILQTETGKADGGRLASSQDDACARVRD